MIDVTYIGGVSPLTLAFPERTLTVARGEVLTLMEGEAALVKNRGDFRRVKPEQPLKAKKKNTPEAPALSATTEPEEASK